MAKTRVLVSVCILGPAPFLRYSLSKGPKLLYLATPLLFNSPDGGFHWDDLRKIFTEMSEMAKVLNGVETLLKISIT